MQTITEKLYFALNKKVIDWNRLEEYISSLGEDINLYDEQEEECILSQAYKAHFGTGYINEKLTDLFIKHGFDLTYIEDHGKHDWDFWDKYIQDVLKWLPLDERKEGLSSGHVQED